MRRLGEAAWAGLKVTMASGCLHIKSRRVELQLRGRAEGCGATDLPLPLLPCCMQHGNFALTTMRHVV